MSTPQKIDSEHVGNIEATLSRILFQIHNDKTIDPRYLSVELYRLARFLESQIPQSE